MGQRTLVKEVSRFMFGLDKCKWYTDSNKLFGKFMNKNRAMCFLNRIIFKEKAYHGLSIV